MQSLLITTIISLALKWHLFKLCMEGSVKHHYFGTRLVRVNSLDQTAFGKQKSKLRSLGRISKQHSHVKRVMLILGEERWFWKLVIMHISECRLFVVYGGLMSEGSYHLDSSDLSR
jgi:hypothetical protein